MLQDAVEPSKAASQGGAQSELAEQSTAHANGNSNSDIGLHAATQSRQQLPIHPLFNANSSRVYPEWSVPEPVALPRRANGFWGSSWSQPLVAEATQAAATHAQALPEPAQFHSPALGIPDTQITKSESLEGAPFQPAQTPDVPHAPTQSAADQLQTVETMPAQQSPLPGLVSEQPHHPTTGQVSTTQPSSSAATLHPTPATTNAQPPLHDMPLHIVATQNAATAVEQRSANELPQPVSNQQQQQPPRHLQAGQQHSEATLYWQSKQQPPQQQQQQQQLEQQGAPQQQTEDMQHHQQASQHLLELVTGSADQAPAETEGMNQEPAGGATDEAPMTAAPNVGAYSQRELFLQNMESAGEMSFEYVLNDGQRHNSIWSVISLGTTDNIRVAVNNSDCVRPLLFSFVSFARLTGPLRQYIHKLCVPRACCSETSGPPCQLQLHAASRKAGLLATSPHLVSGVLLMFAQADRLEEHFLKATTQHAAGVHSPFGSRSAAPLRGHHQAETKRGGRDHIPPLPQAALWGDRLLCSHCQ